jgi:hypothetical protein
VAHQLEVGVIELMGDTVLDAGEEVVDAEHVMTVREQSLLEVATEEAGAADDKKDALA